MSWDPVASALTGCGSFFRSCAVLGTLRPRSSTASDRSMKLGAYIAHPLLGPRLILCTEAVLGISDRSLQAIFGSPDDMKFRSSMTLFALTAGNPDSVFQRALDRYCGGRMDERTVGICDASASRPR